MGDGRRGRGAARLRAARIFPFPDHAARLPLQTDGRRPAYGEEMALGAAEGSDRPRVPPGLPEADRGGDPRTGTFLKLFILCGGHRICVSCYEGAGIGFASGVPARVQPRLPGCVQRTCPLVLSPAILLPMWYAIPFALQTAGPPPVPPSAYRSGDPLRRAPHLRAPVRGGPGGALPARRGVPCVVAPS